MTTPAVLSDRESWLAAICADPADDTVRLAFADWLDENGDWERAGYIRHHIRGDRLPLGMIDSSPSLEWHPILEGYTRQELIDSVRYVRGPGDIITLIYRRGFVSEVRCPLAAWLQHGPAVVRSHPITRVRLDDFEPLGDGWDTPASAWCWLKKTPGTRQSWEVPEELWGDELGTWYDSEQAAHDALSAAAIAWAKSAPVPPA